MLNRYDMKSYRELRGLTFRQVAEFCDVSHTMISEIEKGKRALTEKTYREIIKGINAAYAAKLNGTVKEKYVKSHDYSSTDNAKETRVNKSKKEEIKYERNR